MAFIDELLIEGTSQHPGTSLNQQMRHPALTEFPQQLSQGRTPESIHLRRNQDFDTFTNVIDVYVNYLRNKIDRGRTKKLIHTIRGSGYMLKAD